MQRVVGMCAYMNPRILAYNIGIDDFSTDDIPNMFPVEKRRIYYRPVASVSRKTTGTAYPLLANEISGILEENKDVKGIVHCVSYDLAKYLCEHVRQRGRVITHNSYDREEKIADFKKANRPMVLFSPSIVRGESFDDDMSRFNILPKVPYGNLGDPQISRRVYSDKYHGREWYIYNTIADVIQSCGRSNRSMDDWSRSYLLDEQFGTLIRENRRLFSKWWLDAIDWGDS